jgi:hypothetical protein
VAPGPWLSGGGHPTPFGPPQVHLHVKARLAPRNLKPASERPREVPVVENLWE